MPANPAKTQVRLGFEATQGAGDPAAWQDVRILNETLGSDNPVIEDESIIDSAEQAEGLETKVTPGGDLNWNWSPEDHGKPLANFFGKGAAAVESPTGVWTHRLQVSETVLTFNRLAVEISRDLDNAQGVKRPDLNTGALFSQLTFNAGPRSLLNGAGTLVVPRFHYFADANPITGTGTSPFIRGFGSYANLISAGDLGDVFVQCSTGPTSTMGIKTKLGAAATYDGAELTISPNIWYEIFDENDLRIGDTGIPVELMWPDFTGILVNDDWSFDRERAVWAQSLATAAVCNEVDITVTIDGTKFRTRDLSLTLTRPAAPDEAIGGRFIDHDQISDFGQRTAVGQLNRRALDTSLVDRLLRKQPFALQVDAFSTDIAATGVRRAIKIIMKNCIASGRTPSVAGAASFDEPIEFVAHPSADVTYPSAVAVEIVNSQADLTA
jgi:hypothetical protein